MKKPSKEQISRWHKTYYEKHKDRVKLSNDKWRTNNKQKHRNYVKKSRSRPEYKVIEKKYNRKYQKERSLKIKQAVLSHYSGGRFDCGCCGEDEPKFLSIDHINGGGNKHRKQIKINIYYFLYRNKFPDGYQVLCFNCNLAKGFWGKCPHKE